MAKLGVTQLHVSGGAFCRVYEKLSEHLLYMSWWWTPIVVYLGHVIPGVSFGSLELGKESGTDKI